MSEYLGRLMHTHCKLCQSDSTTGTNYFYAIFRIVVALLFMQHGAQKLFGLLGGVDGLGGTVETFSLLWVAGVIEFFGGAAIALGIFTRFFALISTLEMAYAYFFIHLLNGFFPVINGGELAMLFLVSFLVITVYGGGKLSVERGIAGQEII